MAIESINGAGGYQISSMQQPTSTRPVAENTDGFAMQDVSSKSGETTAKIERNDGKQTDNHVDYETQDWSQGWELNQETSQEQLDIIKKYIDDLNKKMYNSEAQYGIHEATNRVTIKIIDKTTKEVIKELPPEKTLDMIAKAWEMAGILVDEKR